MRIAAEQARKQTIERIAYWRGRASQTDPEILSQMCADIRNFARTQADELEAALAENDRVMALVRETGSDLG